MTEYPSLFRKYILATNNDETLLYENRLYVYYLVPLEIFFTLFSLILFSLIGINVQIIIFNATVYIANVIFLIIINHFVKNEKIKANLILLAIIIILAFVVIQYYEVLGMVVWVISACFIMMSIGRNDLKLLTAIAVDLIVLAVYIYIKYPDQRNITQSVSMILAFASLFGCAVLVKKISSTRYKVISEQLEQADIISQISSQIIGITLKNADEKIAQFLEAVGKHYAIDNVCIMRLSADGSILRVETEWCMQGVEPVSNGKLISISDDYWWTEQVKQKKLLVIDNIEIIDSKISNGKANMMSVGIKSMMSIPIVMNDNVFGFVLIHSIKQKRTWRDDQKRMMTVLANILGDAYTKIESEKEINYIAYFDSLTGLPNRVLFNNTVDEAIINAKNQGTCLAILFIDLDSFKSVNDTMGHEGGDRLLVQVAKCLQEVLGPNDFGARFGGDEFIVLLSQVHEIREIEERITKIMSTFADPISVNNHEFFVTASCGISVYPIDGDNRDALIKNADLAMYSAKESGKNQYSFCTADMRNEIENKVRITNMLYKAQQNNELMVYYQPQVSILTKRIIGIEALLRWKNPELGMIQPSVFVPLAEQSGLINPIGQWVFETACKQNKEWQDKGLPAIRVAVNLSIEQFRNPSLVQMITRVLQETGLDANYVELEITESIAIKETHSVIPVLTKLKMLGVSISIDDFGTDYSSLARLKDLPIDRIKMAMEFVHGITISDKDEAIVNVIITLARSLGLKVIAEGVETAAQLDFLEQRICDEVQGYYFYRPMPAEELESILRAPSCGGYPSIS